MKDIELIRSSDVDKKLDEYITNGKKGIVKELIRHTLDELSHDAKVCIRAYGDLDSLRGPFNLPELLPKDRIVYEVLVEEGFEITQQERDEAMKKISEGMTRLVESEKQKE